MKSGSPNDLNITLQQLPKEELLANDLLGPNVKVYEVRKIVIHEDFERGENNLAILTVAKPFDDETQKGELQTKNYEPKSKVQSNLVIVNNGYYTKVRSF